MTKEITNFRKNEEEIIVAKWEKVERKTKKVLKNY